MSAISRPLMALVVLVLVLATLGLGSVAFDSASDDPEPTEAFVSLDGESATLWPYTSRATAFEERTLALNLIVYGDTEATRLHLTEQSEGDWNETDDEEEDVGVAEDDEAVFGTVTAWGDADGSTRYTYVSPTPSPDDGVWLDESYELHDGTYLGTRHHIRAYESPAGEDWTAIQAHQEHWDWFHLRHTVDSIEQSQQYVEAEFMDRWFVDDVTRVHMGNDRSSDADGWVTAVELADHPAVITASIVGLLGASVLRRVDHASVVRYWQAPRVRNGIALPVSLIAVYLFVRFGAIALEGVFSSFDPRIVAAGFYPLLLVGLPVCTYLFARRLDRPTAFSAASIGFAVAILLDYTLLGVTRLPVDVLVHRFSAAVALGFLAVGASHAERFDSARHGYVRTGVVLWVVVLLLPLLQFV
ncbi:hypothetical protein [Natronococcus occultus]|uniref:Uncharacterized protein n=1 Tax=Natronococcus occultus SP4 TaxID=694430 RepID=L0K3K6_9EURY|nr:hypothetical protein [Natronococcus occultus]AGB38693.1 hypothetical protein Natoc_2937 [Natronococcus occultus SP4]